MLDNLNWEKIQGYLMPLVMALVIFIVGRWVAKMVKGLLHKVLTARGVDSTLTGFLESIAYMLLMTMVVIAAVSKLGVDTTSFAAILAAAGFAIGMALQGSLGNFAAGVMIILFRPFKAGDFVEIAGQAGVVLEVQVFATMLKTGDNKKVIIPNGAITGGNIVNYSAHDTRRVDMVFGCGYGDDILKAKAILMDILEKDERVLKDPAPSVALCELADSSVNFNVRPWVKSADYWDVRAAVHEQVKLRFDAEGLEIPYPQRDVHMHQAS
ncbi:MAG TPA: mechanosensitive ion channel [Planctomycetes bacterium]|nr:mechanosensitive ion channel [Planctomycetota bacterium]